MDKTAITNMAEDTLFDEIRAAIASKEYGSVEIYVEAGRVVQITERTIKKTTSKTFNNELTHRK